MTRRFWRLHRAPRHRDPATVILHRAVRVVVPSESCDAACPAVPERGGARRNADIGFFHHKSSGGGGKGHRRIFPGTREKNAAAAKKVMQRVGGVFADLYVMLCNEMIFFGVTVGTAFARDMARDTILHGQTVTVKQEAAPQGGRPKVG